MIELKFVTKTYISFRGKTHAVHNVSLVVPDGQILAITGHSGSGKSTLLNLISGLDQPTEGDIIVLDKHYKHMNQNDIAKFRNQQIGYIFQHFYLEPEYTVYQNVEIPLIIAGVEPKERKERIEKVLEQVNLLHKIDQKTRFLSGGEQQKCCVARALVNDPKIIFADEPCGKLDSTNGKIIMDLLISLKKQNKTVLIVTHNLEDAKMADRQIIMKDGKIIEDQLLNN